MMLHLVSRRNCAEDPTGRLDRAQRSWQLLYDAGGLKECFHWDKCATKPSEGRQLPKLKEVIEFGLKKCKRKQDPILFTNDDVILHPAIVSECDRHARLYGAGVMRRVDIAPKELRFPEMLLDTPLMAMSSGSPHIGRDGVLLTGEWWERWGELVPDFYLGAPRWDFCIALLLRRIAGFDIQSMDVNTLYRNFNGCDLPDGILFHETHKAKWTEDEREPKREHNENLFSEFCDKYCKGLDSQKTVQTTKWAWIDFGRYYKLYDHSVLR